jgi:hypothetical protein
MACFFFTKVQRSAVFGSDAHHKAKDHSATKILARYLCIETSIFGFILPPPS